MSSIYRLICLSHDPGLELETEWQSGQDGRRIAELELPSPKGSSHEEIRQHAHCDLVIGRCSYPIIEVGYRWNEPSCNPVKWVDVAWLRVLAAAVLIHDKTGNQIPPMPHGWTADRVRRLAPHLGLDEQPANHTAPASCACHNWANDIRVGWPDGHHPRCDGTGQHKPYPRTDPHGRYEKCFALNRCMAETPTHCTCTDEDAAGRRAHTTFAEETPQS